MKKRLITSTIAILLIMVMLAGCGGGSSNTPTGGGNTGSNTATPPANNTPSGNSSGGNTSVPPASQGKSNDGESGNPDPSASLGDNAAPAGSGNPSGINSNIQGLTLFGGRDFSDGVAWVITKDDAKWRLIEKTGNVILELDENEEPSSDFGEGVAVVKRENGTLELIDKAGNVISSPSSGEYDNIHQFIRELGMIVVRKHIETFALTETQFGTIDNKGQWQVNLQALPAKDYAVGGIYIGGGFLKAVANASIGDVNIYNVFTGDFDYYYGNHELRYVVGVSNFENGYGVFTDAQYWNVVCSTDTEGNTSVIYSREDQSSNVAGAYREGLFFMKSGRDVQGFFDIEGNQVIDLSEYTIGSNFRPEFSDGYCLLLLRNPQGSPYYTIIDRTGNFMFEPRLYDDYSNSSSRDITFAFNCGVLVITTSSHSNYTNYNTTIMDIYGETIAELNEPITFIEDIARIDTTGFNYNAGASYGEVYYIDKMGNRLF
ncbi:MAG: hypothetical protein FWG28_04615 [Clostridiales bacterium]|nr:hypothetical protein [Clostridiales bacterium]